MIIMAIGWRRRRRHNDAGGFYWNSSKWRPTSWGVQEGPVTWNETNHRGSIRLGWLGQITFGRGRRREDPGFVGSLARLVGHVIGGLIVLGLFLLFVVVMGR